MGLALKTFDIDYVSFASVPSLLYSCKNLDINWILALSSWL